MSTISSPALTTHCFSVPSKTFLLGEYAVLAKHPAMLINTVPRFSLLLTQLRDHTAPCEYNHVDKNGAVGKLCELISQQCQGYQFSFVDPHQGIGGFGASSAQYGLLFAAYYHITQQTMQPDICLTHYLNHSHTLGQSPSGADLMAQLHGQISIVDPNTNQCTPITWPWPDVHCVLLRTQHKVATHQHLANLTTFPAQQLGDLSMAGIKALQQHDQISFIDTIQATAACLQHAQLTHINTSQLLTRLADCPFVLAAKGCGALGADVILAIVPTDSIALLKTWICTLPLTYSSDTRQLSEGLSMAITNNREICT